MTVTDEQLAVLAFIGRYGRTVEAVTEEFPGADMTPLLEAGYVRRVPERAPEGETAEDTRAARGAASGTLPPQYELTQLGLAKSGIR